MFLLLLLAITIIAVLVGRLALNRWFNHLSLYSLVWGCCLILAEGNFIRYNAISGLAWFYIFSAWFTLYLGSFTVLWGKKWPETRSMPSPSASSWRLLERVIWGFSLLGIVALVVQVRAVLGEFDSLLTAVFMKGNDLYQARLDSPEISGMSYIGSFPFAACGLAGVYAARIGKFRPVAIVPLVLVTLNGILAMGRAGMICAGVWFLTAFLHTPRTHFRISRTQAVVAVTIIAVVLTGFVVISGSRGLDVAYSSLSPSMERASQYIPQLPSFYFYFTAPVISFSQYLDHPEHTVNGFPGMYTFAPIFRLLAAVGAGTAVPYYEEFYYTPAPVNIHTYLKNVHADFGSLGILVFPYVLGALLTWLQLSLRDRFSTTRVVLLAHLYLIIFFSFAYNPMLLGVWYISVCLGGTVGHFIDVRGNLTGGRGISTTANT